ncbi:helix-turn-helix transcriptional regulator [Paracoccus limosus]|uniref:helix-turn-helix transcriptional regulator n=1 Tax=Paracoccus limosus TaxID=913252 RepID=UPI001478EF8A|nr:helix-turn-helix transcriptional regulator [Paracoccus limosus]
MQQLIATLHHAALQPAGWHGFLLALERAVPGVGATLFGVNAASREAIYVTTGQGIDAQGLKVFADYYHRINPFSGYFLNLAPGRAERSLAHIDDAQLQRTEFYNDWMRQQDDLIGGVALKTRAYRSSSLFVGVNVRRQRREETDARALVLLEQLEPYISHAFEVSQVVAELRATALTGRDDQADQGGVVITDHDFMVLWADPAILSGMAGLLRVDMLGRLRFGDPDVQLWAAQDQTRFGRGGNALRQCEAGPYIIRKLIGPHAEMPVSPLFPGFFHGSGWSERQRTFVISRRNRQVTIEDRLGARFQLSAAEVAIATLIAEGHSTQEMADLRQTSLHTIRNQIRAVLAKMEVRDRGGVIREVMAEKNRNP